MQEIDIDRTAEALRLGQMVIDVREPAEYVAGHVPGVVHIPMGQLPGRLDELDRTRPVLVICATGNRSGVMAEVLAAAGFDAASVTGGTTAWARSGRVLES